MSSGQSGLTVRCPDCGQEVSVTATERLATHSFPDGQFCYGTAMPLRLAVKRNSEDKP